MRHMARKPGKQSSPPDLFESRRAEVEGHASRVTEKIVAATRRAKSEEDIRVAVERALGSFADELGVRLEGDHEYTLLRGQVEVSPVVTLGLLEGDLLKELPRITLTHSLGSAVVQEDTGRARTMNRCGAGPTYSNG